MYVSASTYNENLQTLFARQVRIHQEKSPVEKKSIGWSGRRRVGECEQVDRRFGLLISAKAVLDVAEMLGRLLCS